MKAANNQTALGGALTTFIPGNVTITTSFDWPKLSSPSTGSDLHNEVDLVMAHEASKKNPVSVR